ncbi:fatty acid desaturase [Chthoniobacter flavus Ellin428]|uniref:Fatty acid desaturase n=1 Tax=Chthoniobacter flavus Ellin428 TaxID=497964 RepID=B4CUK4_9BACT|nr:fatty acid desaturase [Chthoniobacter flavus]EDY22242.1 fatty acid desaturase [Chthoniobacter flavus Ellin428]TCO94736.1 fatty acid desaturase [Chthoniobacter flavus]
MNSAPTTEIDVDLHEPHWITRVAFPILAALLGLSQVSLAVAVYHHVYWVAVILVFVVSHLMHGMLIGFHEATHGLLRENRTLNEIDGVLIGTLSLMSFSLYRAAHQMHHAYLATERDEELWPFIHPRMNRGVRVLAAVAELTMGMFFTPFLFFRTFLRKDSPVRSQKVRRRVWLEIVGMAVAWPVILSVIGYFHWWTYFLWMHLAPAWLAGNMQSVRKYVEHVGLTGATVNASTRSVVAEGWTATFLNFTLLHEPYHGVHHWRSGLSHPDLPRHAAALEPAVAEERPPFRSFTAAVWDLIINLPDPKVGAQWRGVSVPTRQELARQGTN